MNKTHTIRRWMPEGKGALLITVRLGNLEEGDTLTMDTGEVITVCASDLTAAPQNEYDNKI